MGPPVLAHSDSPSLGPIWAPGGEDAPGRVGRAERADVPALGWRCLPGGSLHGLPPRQTPRPSPHVEAVGPSGLWPHLGSRGTWASLGNSPHQALEAGSVRLREEVLGDRTADGGHVRPGDLPARRGVAGEWGTRPAGVRWASARPSESPGGSRAAPVCPGFLCADGMCRSLARHHLPPVSEVQTGSCGGPPRHCDPSPAAGIRQGCLPTALCHVGIQVPWFVLRVLGSSRGPGQSAQGTLLTGGRPGDTAWVGRVPRAVRGAREVRDTERL